MAIAFVKDFYSETNTLTVPAGGIAQNNLLVLGMFHDDDAHQVTAINDTSGNTYSQVLGSPLSNGGRDTQMWYGVALTALASGNSITLTQVSSTCGCIAAEFSGCARVSPFDTSQVKNEYTGGTTQSHTSNSTATTSQADELLVGVHGQGVNHTWTATGGFTVNDTQNPFAAYRLVMQYQVVASTGSYASTGTTVEFDQWENIIATFKAASAAGVQGMVALDGVGLGRW